MLARVHRLDIEVLILLVLKNHLPLLPPVDKLRGSEAAEDFARPFALHDLLCIFLELSLDSLVQTLGALPDLRLSTFLPEPL